MPTYLLNKITVQIDLGDITLQEVDAIVNAANSHLQHGGGVAATIVRRGGFIIQQESNEWIRQHGLASHEHPAITGAGNLSCRYIIHAVGPIWGEGNEVEKLMLAICSSLQIASDLKCISVAFPALSTGIFGFPVKMAAKVFFEAISSFSNSNPLPFLQTIKIVLFDLPTFDVFITAFNTGNATS